MDGLSEIDNIPYDPRPLSEAFTEYVSQGQDADITFIALTRVAISMPYRFEELAELDRVYSEYKNRKEAID